MLCTGLEPQIKDGPGLGCCDELVSIQAHNSGCQRSLDISCRPSQAKCSLKSVWPHLMLFWPEPGYADQEDWQVSLASDGAVETWPVVGRLTGRAACGHQKHMWTGAYLCVWLEYISFCPVQTSKQLLAIPRVKFTLKSKFPYGLFQAMQSTDLTCFDLYS